MNDISFAWLFWKPQSSDRQGRAASIIFWMLCNDFSPLSQKVNLTHLRLLTYVSFSSFSPSTQSCSPWDTLAILVWACCPCFHLVWGGQKMVAKGTAGTNPFRLGRERWLLALILREGRRKTLLLGYVQREGWWQQQEANWWMQNSHETGLQHSCSTLGAMDKTQLRNWLYFQIVKPDFSDPPQCSSNHTNFSLSLFPDTFKTVSIILWDDSCRSWPILNWNTLIKSPLTI